MSWKWCKIHPIEEETWQKKG